MTSTFVYGYQDDSVQPLENPFRIEHADGSNTLAAATQEALARPFFDPADLIFVVELEMLWEMIESVVFVSPVTRGLWGYSPKDRKIRHLGMVGPKTESKNLDELTEYLRKTGALKGINHTFTFLEVSYLLCELQKAIDGFDVRAKPKGNPDV